MLMCGGRIHHGHALGAPSVDGWPRPGRASPRPLPVRARCPRGIAASALCARARRSTLPRLPGCVQISKEPLSSLPCSLVQILKQPLTCKFFSLSPGILVARSPGAACSLGQSGCRRSGRVTSGPNPDADADSVPWPRRPASALVPSLP